MALANLPQTISHQQLIVACREYRRRYVHQNTNPRIGRKGARAEEDGSYNARAEVTGEIGGDGVSCEAPDHNGVGDADGEWYGNGGDEGVCRVKARPDHDADEAVDEEFLEEEVTLVCLVGIWKRAEDARHAAVEGRRAVRLQVECLGGLDLGPVAAHQQQACDESAKDLREDVVGDFAPREALPDSEAECDSGVEVATGNRGAGDDGERDADCEGPTDLEDRAEDGDAYFFASGGGGSEGEGCNGGNTGEAEGACQVLYSDRLSQLEWES